MIDLFVSFAFRSRLSAHTYGAAITSYGFLASVPAEAFEICMAFGLCLRTIAKHFTTGTFNV